jgi:hypothetical protein
MSLQIASPFQQFFDRDGSPLDNGFVYVGTANLNPETNPLTVYFDDALTIPAAQPLRTSNGYIVRNGSPARIYTSQEDFSLTVREKNNVLVYTVADATSLSNLQIQLASSSGSSLVGYNQGGTGAVTRTVQARLRDYVSVKDFGAVGDGITDDSGAVQDAIDSNPGALYFPEGDYLIGSPISVTNPISMLGGAGSTIVPSLGLTGGNLFTFETDNVTIDGLTFDATGQTYTTATGNTRIILLGGFGSATKYYNHVVTRCNFVNVLYNNGWSGVLATHAVYVDNVDDVTIIDNTFDGVGGAAVFAKSSHNLVVENNYIKDTRWYSVNLDYDIQNFSVANNTFNLSLPEGINYGGAVNTVSNYGLIPVQNGVIARNSFSGNFAYGSIIRIQSSKNIVIESNIIEEGCDVGTQGVGGTLGAIRVTTRGLIAPNPTPSIPSENITIRNNYIYGAAGGVQRNAIYVNNDGWVTRQPFKNIHIYGNHVFSTDTSNYWQNGVQISGNEGGAENIWVHDNYLQTYTRSGSPVGGAIGVASSSALFVADRIWIGGNVIEDIGTPAASYQNAVYIGNYTDNIRSISPNYISNFFYGVRTISGAGPTLELLDDQWFDGCTTNTLFGQALSRYGKQLFGSAAGSSSIAVGTTTFQDITVTGAALGDIPSISFSADISGLFIVAAKVRATNSVRVLYTNTTGGVIDASAITVQVTVNKKATS